jgi:hypothetical protein
MAQGKRQGERLAEGNGARASAQEQPSGEDLIMRLAPGERFYKFYILAEPTGQPGQRVEHRILSKEHADGSLEMVSYNAWLADGHSEKRDMIRVPSLSKDLFDELVARVRAQSDVPPESFQEVDLSGCESVEEQVRMLAGLGR